MSRIGRMPVEVPANVNVEISGDKIVVSGPLGRLEQTLDKSISAAMGEHNGKKAILLSRSGEDKEIRAKHGMYRALVHNMVVGATQGYSKTLVINGVGYKAATSGNKLTLNIGFSHPIEFVAPDGIKLECPSITEVKVSGNNKEVVGQVAADIRALKPVEPYHAYGIHYADEVVIRKEGKKASKKK